MQRIQTPNAAHAYDARLDLDGVLYTFIFRWNWRSADWRLTVRDETTGEYLASNRRLSSGAVPLILPAGQLIVAGDDPYEPDHLGQSLVLYYVPDDEVVDTINVLDGDPTFWLT